MPFFKYIKIFSGNVNKKKDLIISNYTLNNVLSCYGLVKDLGVLLDYKLSFSGHTDEIIKSGLKVLGFIIGMCNIFSIEFAYVRSKLEYRSIIWYPLYSYKKIQSKECNVDL